MSLKIKKYNVALIIPFIATIALLVFYNIYFQNPISKNHQVWSEFGGFMGGVLGTFFSYIALIYIIKSNKEQSDNFIEQNTNFINEIELRNHYKEIDFIRDFLINIINKKYSVNEMNLFFNEGYRSIINFRIFEPSLFSILADFKNVRGRDELKKKIAEDNSVIINDLKTFSAQLTYYIIFIDELHAAKEKYFLKESNFKYRLSLFKTSLFLLREYNLIDDGPFERYLILLYSPFKTNDVLFSDKMSLITSLYEELENQGFLKDRDISKYKLGGKIYDEINNYSYHYHFENDKERLVRIPNSNSNSEATWRAEDL